MNARSMRLLRSVAAGLLAGLASALLVGAVFGTWFFGSARLGLLIGAVAGIFGPVGDLFESAVKRDLSVKDSGRLLGGHGGMLDRLDALLWAGPTAFYVVLAFGAS